MIIYWHSYLSKWSHPFKYSIYNLARNPCGYELHVLLTVRKVASYIVTMQEEKITGDWKELYLHSSRSDLWQIKSKKMKLAERKASLGQERNAYKAFVRTHEGSGALWKHRCGREHNTKMYLKEIRQECVHWTDLAQVR